MGAGVGSPGRVERRDRSLEVIPGELGASGEPGHLPGPLLQGAPRVGVVGERERLLEVAPCLLAGRELRGPLAGSRQHHEGLGLHLAGVVRLGGEYVGLEVMRGDDLDDLLVLGSPSSLQVGRHGEVLVLALALGEGLVGDGPHKVLQEAELPAVGRPWVGLERDDLLSHEGPQQLVERVGTEVGEGEQRCPAEGLADDSGLGEVPAGARPSRRAR